MRDIGGPTEMTRLIIDYYSAYFLSMLLINIVSGGQQLHVYSIEIKSDNKSCHIYEFIYEYSIVWLPLRVTNHTKTFALNQLLYNAFN